MSLSPPPVLLSSFISLAAEPVTFVACWYGGGLALAFQSQDMKAIERCYNWSVNTSVCKGRLNWMGDQWASMPYVYVSDMDALRRGLIAQFRVEAIRGGEVTRLVDAWVEAGDPEDDAILPPTHDLAYDEDTLLALATGRAEAFIQTQLTWDSFMDRGPRSIGPTYEFTRSSFRRFNSGDSDNAHG